MSERLMPYRGASAVVLAIPRGGVVTGWAVAKPLGLPLDIVLSKKIGHPDNKEFAIGSVNLYGALVREQVDVSSTYLKKEITAIQKLLQERYHYYGGESNPIDLHEKIAIIVDDGVATGSTLESSIDAVEAMNPEKIVVAVPVGPPYSVKNLSGKVDQMICLHIPDDFYAVGQFYNRFPQISDQAVKDIMTNASAYRKKLPNVKPIT